MKKQIFAVLAAAVLGTAALSGCSSEDKNTSEKTATLTIPAAASLTDVTEDIAAVSYTHLTLPTILLV